MVIKIMEVHLVIQKLRLQGPTQVIRQSLIHISQTPSPFPLLKTLVMIKFRRRLTQYFSTISVGGNYGRSQVQDF